MNKNNFVVPLVPQKRPNNSLFVQSHQRGIFHKNFTPMILLCTNLLYHGTEKTALRKFYIYLGKMYLFFNSYRCWQKWHQGEGGAKALRLHKNANFSQGILQPLIHQTF